MLNIKLVYYEKVSSNLNSMALKIAAIGNVSNQDNNILPIIL